MPEVVEQKYTVIHTHFDTNLHINFLNRNETEFSYKALCWNAKEGNGSNWISASWYGQSWFLALWEANGFPRWGQSSILGESKLICSVSLWSAEICRSFWGTNQTKVQLVTWRALFMQAPAKIFPAFPAPVLACACFCLLCLWLNCNFSLPNLLSHSAESWIWYHVKCWPFLPRTQDVLLSPLVSSV